MCELKKLGLIILIIGFWAKSFAQFTPMNLPNFDRQEWHFGFTLGINNMNFRIDPIMPESFDRNLLIVEPLDAKGFNIGIVANKRLGDFFDLRFVPTISFGDRSLRYTFIENDTVMETYVKNVTSTYLDFPFTVKYKSKRLPNRLRNVRAYVFTGFRYSVDLSSQRKKDKNNQDIVLKLNPHDVFYELGVGFDFYMKYFKFGVEIKQSLGFLNVLYHENNKFTDNINGLKSTITWVTFTFE